MTTDGDFDRIAAAWLADGPDELSGRVLAATASQVHVTRQRRTERAPWRIPTTTVPVRVAAAAVIGVLAVGGALLVLGRPSQPAVGGPSQPAVGVPSPSRDATPAASTSAGTFTSPRNGYSIDYPAGWTATPATTPWLAGTDLAYGDPTLDTIGTPDARLAVASQPLQGTWWSDRQLRDGQTPRDWLLADCSAPGYRECPATLPSGCPTDTSCGARILIGGQPGWLEEDGSPATGGTVVTGGVIFAAAVVVGDRGYVFTLDGKVDKALFESLLASVTFDPDGAVDLPPLTKTFTSTDYGYSIGVGEGFTTTPGASRTSLGVNTGDRDGIKLTTDDGFMTAASEPTPAGVTLDEWLAAEFPARAAEGGLSARADPATWPPVQVGNQTGRLNEAGHSVTALVVVGGRAYTFSWQYQITYTHHTLGDWKELLKSVTFDPAAARD